MIGLELLELAQALRARSAELQETHNLRPLSVPQDHPFNYTSENGGLVGQPGGGSDTPLTVAELDELLGEWQ